VIPGRFGRLLTGTLLFIGMFALFLLGGDDRAISGSAALFFSAITAYVVPVFSYIIQISVQAVSDLEELLQLTKAEFLEVRSSISHRPAWWNAMVCVLGVTGGLFHINIQRGSLTDAWRLGLGDRGELLEHIGTASAYSASDCDPSTCSEHTDYCPSHGSPLPRLYPLSALWPCFPCCQWTRTPR
jgi:hypothetical protein